MIKLLNINEHVPKALFTTTIHLLREIPPSLAARSADTFAKSIVSADRHIVRVWDSLTGKGFTNIQPPAEGINDVLLINDSGLIMVACDDPKIQVCAWPQYERAF